MSQEGSSGRDSSERCLRHVSFIHRTHHLPHTALTLTRIPRLRWETTSFDRSSNMFNVTWDADASTKRSTVFKSANYSQRGITGKTHIEESKRSARLNKDAGFSAFL